MEGWITHIQMQKLWLFIFKQSFWRFYSNHHIIYAFFPLNSSSDLLTNKYLIWVIQMELFFYLGIIDVEIQLLALQYNMHDWNTIIS